MGLKIILLRGPAGVGKSTIGKMLKEKFGENWVHLDIDKIKHVIAKSSSETRSTIAHNVANYFIEQLFKNGFNVIVDEIFVEPYYRQVLKLSEKYKVDTYQFFLQAPLDTLLQRDKDREVKTKGKETIEFLHGMIKPMEGESVLYTAVQTQNNLVETIVEVVTR